MTTISYTHDWFLKSLKEIKWTREFEMKDVVPPAIEFTTAQDGEETVLGILKTDYPTFPVHDERILDELFWDRQPYAGKKVLFLFKFDYGNGADVFLAKPSISQKITSSTYQVMLKRVSTVTRLKLEVCLPPDETV